MEKTTIGARLRALRAAKGKTQEQVAKAIGVSVSSIAMYELDERVPRDAVKVKIAKYFGKSISAIFFT